MLTVLGLQELRPWTVFSVCNAPGGGGQGGDAPGGSSWCDGVLGPGF